MPFQPGGERRASGECMNMAGGFSARVGGSNANSAPLQRVQVLHDRTRELVRMAQAEELALRPSDAQRWPPGQRICA